MPALDWIQVILHPGVQLGDRALDASESWHGADKARSISGYLQRAVRVSDPTVQDRFASPLRVTLYTDDAGAKCVTAPERWQKSCCRTQPLMLHHASLS